MATDPYRPRRALGAWPESPTSPDPEVADDVTATRPAAPPEQESPPAADPAVSERPETGNADDLPPIVFRGLSKRFGPVRAVDDLTFTVPPGRVTGFLGPNGAGKTTTLRMLVGLIAPSAGTATFGDRRYVELERPQQTVGVAIDANFHPGRSGRNHLRVLAPTAGVDDARVDEVLELVELSHAAGRRAGGYSLGMRQRLALATALLGDPDYLILDEPANGLDPEGIRWLRSFLKGFAAQGRVVLVSSHMLSEVNQTADDVAVIGAGRLLRHAPIDQLEVTSASSRLVVSDHETALAALAEADISGHSVTESGSALLRVESQDLTAIGWAIFRAGLPIFELVREQSSLEETFFRMLESEAPPGEAAAMATEVAS